MRISSITRFILIVGLGACVYVGCKPVWDFDHLESRARKAVTAKELQTWATNLLSHHTNAGSLRVSEVGKDFPKKLLRVAPELGPSIYVSVPEDTNYPSCVQVFWGSGFLGHKDFLIGPTNFVGPSSSHQWQPGVFFRNND
jgi:hypothetical protein